MNTERSMPNPKNLETFVSETLVNVRNVTKAFGDKVALNDLSFEVPAGQICGLLRPNGAGKTTQFRLLMGILKTSSGLLQVDGPDVFEDRVAVKRLIGFLPDEPVFYSYLSGRELLKLSAGMHGLDVIVAMEWIELLARRLRLADDLDNYAEDYSRGMSPQWISRSPAVRSSSSCPKCESLIIETRDSMRPLTSVRAPSIPAFAAASFSRGIPMIWSSESLQRFVHPSFNGPDSG